MSAFERKEDKKKEKIIEEFEELEFQIFRMKENMKEIAKRNQILGIELTKEDKWVIVYSMDDGNVCRIMLHDCDTPYRGTWDFSIHAQYKDNHMIHIDDIRGVENRGYGSVCMKFLKEHALEQNVNIIKGDIVERDWEHLDRLVHFYKKHNFQVSLLENEKYGEIYWRPAV
ncbi:GNAT family N-acetyltransferase [Bacillus alkalicola]|uniref:GNAT family N-acetyltransferase n=2 Tax=Bacillales TaxID=1385 RepID=A0ABS6JTY7_9BACI|nr:GNAT family N-acetyltransferase [Bacillus alkalicola]